MRQNAQREAQQRSLQLANERAYAQELARTGQQAMLFEQNAQREKNALRDWRSTIQERQEKNRCDAQHAQASGETMRHAAHAATQQVNAAAPHHLCISAGKEINAARQTALALPAKVQQLEREKIAMSRLPSPRPQHFNIGDDLLGSLFQKAIRTQTETHTHSCCGWASQLRTGSCYHQIRQVLIVATTAANHLRVVIRMAMTPGEETVVQENPDDPEAHRLTLVVMTTTMVVLAVMLKSMDSIRGVAKRCFNFCDEPIVQKSRIKEREKIEIAKMLTVIEFRVWKITVRRKVAAAIGLSDEGLKWIMEVEKPTTTFESLAS